MKRIYKNFSLLCNSNVQDSLKRRLQIQSEFQLLQRRIMQQVLISIYFQKIALLSRTLSCTLQNSLRIITADINIITLNIAYINLYLK